MTRARRLRGWVAGLSLLTAGLGVTTLALTDAGAREGRDSRAWTPASAHNRVGYAPDPTPIRSAKQWVLTFQYRHGRVKLTSARQVRLRRAVTTPRRLGRYAVELLSGPTVVERLRFDFPLLGADELAGRPRPYHAPPRFETKATTTHRVMVPDTPRASRARLVDRATGRTFIIPWPPIHVGNRAPRPAAPIVPPKRRVDGSLDAPADAASEAGLDAESDAQPLPDALRRPDAVDPDASPLDGGVGRKP